MRIETLNIWGGQITGSLKEHIQSQIPKVDIFCFQEVMNGDVGHKSVVDNAVMDIFSRLEKWMPGYTGYFESSQDNEEGLAIFYKNNLKIKDRGSIFVYRWENAMENNDPKTLGRNIQYVKLEDKGKEITIINFHGLWNGQGKTDTEDRIKQSRKIKSVIKNIKGEIILCGDFNLNPDTKSLKILEENMRNLVSDFGIKSTRSSFYKKPETYADYIFVSPQIKVINFSVVNDGVSDHLPLVVEFE